MCARADSEDREKILWGGRMKNLWRMSLLLMAVCAIAAGCLSYVYSLTKPRIEKQAELEKIQALKEVMPDATRFDTDTVPDRWIAYKGDRKIGFVIEVSASGYGGPIRIIFGVDENKKITKIKILQQNETPGLGARIKEDKFLAQFCGKGKGEARLKKDDALNGKIDALSGATISSRAVADAVEKGLLELEQGANTDEIAILKEVFPQAENFRMVSSAQTLKIWAGYEGEKMAGWAVETTAKGFGGTHSDSLRTF